MRMFLKLCLPPPSAPPSHHSPSHIPSQHPLSFPSLLTINQHPSLISIPSAPSSHHPSPLPSPHIPSQHPFSLHILTINNINIHSSFSFPHDTLPSTPLSPILPPSISPPITFPHALPAPISSHPPHHKPYQHPSLIRLPLPHPSTIHPPYPASKRSISLTHTHSRQTPLPHHCQTLISPLHPQLPLVHPAT